MTRIVMRESEASFQSAVLQYAELHGWRTYHTHDSRRSNPGFPDLVLVRDGVLIFAELKSETGRVSPAQTEWLAALERVAQCASGPAVDAVQAYVWRPRDWPQIEKVLTRRRST